MGGGSEYGVINILPQRCTVGFLLQGTTMWFCIRDSSPRIDAVSRIVIESGHGLRIEIRSQESYLFGL